MRLTEKETAILRYLYRAGQRPVSRETLLQEVWGYNSGVTTHTLETHIYRLRQKVEKDAASPAILVTESGGYKLVPVNSCVHDDRGRHRLLRTGADARPARPRRVAHSGDRRREPLRAQRRDACSMPASRPMPASSCRKARSVSRRRRPKAKSVKVGPGTLLGELAMLTDTTRPVTATALEPSTVLRIPRTLFLKMLEGYPDAASRLRDMLATPHRSIRQRNLQRAAGTRCRRRVR